MDSRLMRALAISGALAWGVAARGDAGLVLSAGASPVPFSFDVPAGAQFQILYTSGLEVYETPGGGANRIRRFP